MDDRYFFDKRVMKKAFIKYGLIFLFAIPVLVVANYFLNQAIKNMWLVVLIDIVITFAILLIFQLIINAIKQYEINHPKQEKVKSKKKDKDQIVVKAEIVEKDNKKTNKKTTVKDKNKEEE